MFNSFESVEPKVKRRKFSCNVCNRYSIHEAKICFRSDWSEVWSGEAGGEEYFIFKCGGCDHVLFVTDSWNNDDMFLDEENEYDVSIQTKQYPPVIAGLKELDLSACPEGVARVIRETGSSLDNNNLLAATILTRLVIEVICEDLEVGGSNLSSKINNLAKDLDLDLDQKELLHALRKRGNSGAHESKGMSAPEIKAGFDVISIIIDKKYNAPAKAAKAVAKAKKHFKKDI